MKKQINKVLLFSIFILATLISCSKHEDLDTNPPGTVSDITVTSTNGGGIISYLLPSDEDILYVKAVYFNSQDEEVFRVSSKYNSTLEVNGLNQTSPSSKKSNKQV